MTDDPRAIVHAVYDIVSGPIDRPRDWNAMRRLLTPTARLRSVRVDPEAPVLRDLDREAWIETAAARFALDDFHEHGAIRDLLVDGAVATVVSPFVASRSPGGPAIEAGVNHFSFMRMGGAWRVVQILWAVWPSGHPAAKRIVMELEARTVAPPPPCRSEAAVRLEP